MNNLDASIIIFALPAILLAIGLYRVLGKHGGTTGERRLTRQLQSAREAKNRAENNLNERKQSGAKRTRRGYLRSINTKKTT